MTRNLPTPVGNSSRELNPTTSILASGGPSRRDLIATAAAVGVSVAFGGRPGVTAEPDVRFDFTKPTANWETVAGQWGIEDVPGAAQGKALVQRTINNSFNVIVAPGGPYTNIDVSVRFKPISGREDASGGIVFRFADGRYYLIRANALEDNFNLYYFDRSAWFSFVTGGRFEITGASTKAPALGEWHMLRITAEGEHIEGWLNGQRLIDHDDSRFTAGRVGLWTKADSVTAFDSLVVRPI
jgi:3-keto-disaccharide hydrolase